MNGMNKNTFYLIHRNNPDLNIKIDVSNYSYYNPLIYDNYYIQPIGNEFLIKKSDCHFIKRRKPYRLNRLDEVTIL